MIEIHGNYGYAKVFTDALETSAEGLIRAFCDQPFSADSKIRIMPDVHAGKGCTIGTTMTVKDKVVPNIVGVDIGCGMLTVKLKDKRVDLPALDAAGFFAALDGGDARAAFDSASPALSLSPDAAALLRAFFSSCGASVKSEEIAACDLAIGRLDELLMRERRDGAARIKLHSTLLTTGGLLFLLLVI